MDLVKQIEEVRREVGRRTRDDAEVRTLVLAQSYAAPIEDVWDACTNPDRISRWFLPVSGELRLGGRHQLENHAGGTVTACDRPSGFDATWEYQEGVSWIEVRLTAEPGDRTRLQLTHVMPMDDPTWPDFGPGAAGIGWDSMLLGLAGHLSPDGPVVTPDQAEAWMATPEARRFMTDSSEGWYEANVASGTDEATARAAADKSTAAYTGAG